MPEGNPEDRVNIDLSGIDQPTLVNPEDTYDLILEDIELSRSSTDRPMLRCRWEMEHVDPEVEEKVQVRDYPLLDQQSGKYRLRQIVYAKGLDDASWQNDPKVGRLVGTRAKAEIQLDDDEEYGEQNRIRRLLQDVPKAKKRGV